MAITQTRDGYLWLGTEEGLVRFDGIRFQVFNSNKTDIIKGNRVTTLFEDRSGTLWIGSDIGLYSYKENVFTSHIHENSCLGAVISCIYEDSRRRLYTACLDNPLHVLKGNNFSVFSDENGVTLQNIYDIYEDADFSLWFTAGDLFQLKNGQLKRFYTEKILPTKRILTSIEPDGNKGLWIGTLGDGLLHWDGRRFKLFTIREGLSGNIVQHILLDRNGGLWFATDGLGISRFHNGTFENCNTIDGLNNHSITYLYEDKAGDIWIGTNGGGLHQLSETSISTISKAEGLSAKHCLAVLEDHKRNIWIGTLGGGLNCLNHGTLTAYGPEDGLSHTDVMALCESMSGGLWIGTGGGGLNLFMDGQFITPKSDSSTKIIMSLFEDSSGKLWIGNLGLLKTLKNEEFSKLSWCSANVVNIIQNSNQDIWFGTISDGLYCYNKDKILRFTTKDGLSSNAAISLYEDSEGILWIATYGGGLNRMENGVIFSITQNEGLIENNLYCVLEDDLNYLWLSCPKGIFRVPKQEVNELVKGKRERITCRLFNEADGMRNSECCGGSDPAGYKSRDGRLWFTTIDGVVVVDPHNIKTDDKPPHIIIEQVMFNEKIIPIPKGDKSILLPPGRGNFEFQYTAPNYYAPERIRFRYILEGYENKWTDADTRRIAYYTGIPPGHYTFRVSACNPDSVWNEEGMTVKFYLRPFFYQTKWFLSLCLLAFGMLCLGGHRYRLHQIERQRETLSRMVDEQTAELLMIKEQLEERVQRGIDALRVSERMAAYGQLVAGVAHEVRQPIFALQASTYVLSNKLKKQKDFIPQLSILDREIKRMSILMEDLLEFSKPQELLIVSADPVKLLQDAAESFKASSDCNTISVNISVDDNLPKVALDMYRMIQVIVNLMINARKHAEGLNTINLAAKLIYEPEMNMPTNIQFTVADDGCGMADDILPHIFEPFYSKGKGSGLGLAIVQRIVQLHQGNISVKSFRGNGTVFTIILPLDTKQKESSS